MKHVLIFLLLLYKPLSENTNSFSNIFFIEKKKRFHWMIFVGSRIRLSQKSTCIHSKETSFNEKLVLKLTKIFYQPNGSCEKNILSTLLRELFGKVAFPATGTSSTDFPAFGRALAPWLKMYVQSNNDKHYCRYNLVNCRRLFPTFWIVRS